MKRQLCTTLIAILLAFSGFSQIQFWVDDFEGASSSNGSRTASFNDAVPTATRYFRAVTTAEISAAPMYTSMQGTRFWAAEDVDNLAGGDPSQDVSWSVSIAGKTGITFEGFFAATLGTVWDHGTSTALQDFMIIQYKIDSGPWTTFLSFQPNVLNASTGGLSVDSNNDGLGDGTVLTNSFANFSASIPGTGNTLEIRCESSTNALAEELAFDNFRLFEAPACTNPTITTPPSSASVCNAANASFTIAASGATGYQWQANTGSGFANITNGGVYSNATTATLNITGVTSGMSGYLYRCLATSGGGACSTTSSQATLTVSSVNTSSNSQTNVSCNGGANGAASVSPSGGITPYTYSWSPAGGTGSIATGLSAGSYTVTVTDNIGCQGTRNYTITQPPVLNGSTVVTNIACNGGTNGAINLTPSGGTPGYTFSWVSGPTTEDRTGLAAGTYSVTITDANACTRNVTGITVTQPTSAVSGTTVVTNVACNSGTNGAINLTPNGGTGPYTFSWSSGPTTEDRTGLSAGAYSVTITDANACTGTVSGITVTQPTAVSGTRTVTNVACNGGTNGSIDLTPTGGTPGYTYNWGGGVTTQDRTGLAAGTYSVTITDANACTGTVSGITVTQPTAVSGTTVVTNVACFGGNTGAINLTPTGGVGPYTFSWASGPTTEDRTGLTAGTYTVTITDANGCTGTVSPTVTQSASAVSGTTVVTNIACNGGTNGAINLTPTGGTGPYTFNWGGPTTEDRTGLAAGTYSVTITDANACTGTVSGITVTQPTAISVTPASQTNISCFGGSNGAASINTPTGGAGGYTYNWTPGNPTGDGTVSVTGLSATTYTCTVTDANACVASQSFTITAPTAITVTPASQTNVSCFGGSNGAASINTPTGGAGGYTYNWTPGNPTGDGTTSVTGLTGTTYTVTVTDANACVASQSFTITAPTAISVTPASQTNVSCFGGSNGAASINTPTGGAGGYTYNWTPGNPTGDGTVSVTGLSATTYTCTVTDANGCTRTQNFTITAPTAITVTPASQTNVSCFGGSNGAAMINTPTGGAGGYTYNWTPGTPTGDGTVSVTGLAAGTWTCTVTDANGCVASQNFTVTQPTAISVTPASQTNVSCFGGSNGAASINTPTGGAGGYTYNWTPGNPTGDGTTSVTGLTATTYTVTVTDANACVASQSFTVTQPTAISVTAASQTNVSCFGGSNGAASINTPTGGAGGYTYNWTPGNPTGDGTTSVTGLTATTYTVTVTDANGCTANQAFTVTQPTAISVTPASQTNVACNGGSNGAAAINTPTGGAGGYTYNWTPGTPTGDGTVSVTGLAAGTWTCTVTDANGCVASQNFTVTQPTAISVTPASQTNVSCNGGSNGAAMINTPTGGAGGYTYNWTPGNPTGDGTTSVTGLSATTYTVTVTDANGCTANQAFTVTQPTAISVTAASQTNVSCFGGSNGAASINTPTGGAGGYTYDWTPGTPTGDGTTSITGLAAGTYTVTVTDANGCAANQAFTVTQPTAISLTASAQTNVACNGGSNGSASVNPATGGAGGFTYDWTPGTPTGDGTTSITGLAAGSYTVTATDANGCIATQSFTITEPTAISVTAASQTNVACNGGSNGAAAINNPTGGAGGFTYDWTPGTPTGDGTTSITGLTAGSYIVTATDANGCIATQSFTITEPSAISFTAASQTNVSCFGGSTGEASVNAVIGGAGGFTYDWTPGTPTGDGTTSITGLTAGSYTLTATDVNGCIATQGFTITEPALITSSVTETDCDSYTLNGQTYTVSGTYTQTLTAVNGCDSVLTLNLTINNSTSSTTTITECDSYEWTDGTTYTVSGTYTQDLTNSVGCDSTATLVLTINNSTSSTTTVTECDSYTWTDGTTYTVSGTYTQDLTNSVGCDSTATLVLTITTTPVVSVTQSDDITLVATSTSGTYQWIDCATESPVAGETSATFTATQNGSYAVVVTDGPCSVVSACTVIDNVGIEENAANSFELVNVYPNPFNDALTIVLSGNNEPAQLVVLDALGRTVFVATTSANETTIDVSDFASGMYLLKVISGDKIVSRSITK